MVVIQVKWNWDQNNFKVILKTLDDRHFMKKVLSSFTLVLSRNFIELKAGISIFPCECSHVNTCWWFQRLRGKDESLPRIVKLLQFNSNVLVWCTCVCTCVRACRRVETVSSPDGESRDFDCSLCCFWLSEASQRPKLWSVNQNVRLVSVRWEEEWLRGPERSGE